MSLFVSEDDEDQFYDAGVQHEQVNHAEEEQDEVVREIPIHLSSRLDQLSVLQFPNRTKRGDIVSCRVKKESGVMELELPVDTSKFFDLNKANEWGSVQTQTLQGVMKLNDIYYVGSLRDGRLTLTPLASTVQFRPSLKYIDDASLSKKQRLQQLNRLDDSKPKEVKMIQMTVKSSSEAALQRLGGALLAHKKLDEEFSVDYKWHSAQEAAHLRDKLYYEPSDEVLVSDTTESEYINLLFKETIVE